MYSLRKNMKKTVVCILKFEITDLGEENFYEFRLFSRKKNDDLSNNVFAPGGLTKRYDVKQTKFISNFL